MAQSLTPKKQLVFGGIRTDGHLLQRPAESAVVCQDFRVMPGGWLRLRGGRILGGEVGTDPVAKIYEFRRSGLGGGVYHLIKQDGDWKQLNLAAVPCTASSLETQDGTFATTYSAITTVRDKVFWHNGAGYRTSTGKPSLSSWDGTNVRYVGLDAFIPSTAPTVTFTPNPSGGTKIVYHRKFFVGLYNEGTGHFSNGIEIGTVTNPDRETLYTGDLSISGITGLSKISHDAAESAEIKRVIYCTIDGGEVPYLILTPDADGPETSTSLIISDDLADVGTANIVDLTQEMPLSNQPPRNMSLIAYTNGRVYGALDPTGAVTGSTANDFSFEVKTGDASAIVWSAAASDLPDREFVGVPEESFPPTNKKHTPNGETPIALHPAPGDLGHLLVVTKTGTFILEETLPGVHVWRTVSITDGIHSNQSLVDTPYGTMWLTQDKDLVLLKPNSYELRYVSRGYGSLFMPGQGLSADAPADYLRDPGNQIDRYQIWFQDVDGKSVCHDFYLGDGDGSGVAYTTTGQAFDSVRSVKNSSGITFHLATIGNKIYYQEANPVTQVGQIPNSDETEEDTFEEINGTFIGQWMDFGDHEIRKELHDIDIVGDGELSAQLGDRPLAISWYGDFSNPQQPCPVQKNNQSATDYSYNGKVSRGHAFWYKFRIDLSGHSSEGTYSRWQGDGELAPNHYGTIQRMYVNPNLTHVNRPH